MLKMTAANSPHKILPRIPAKKIPAALIYEILDGQPIYFKGYREVLNEQKTIEDIMGSSTLQGFIIEYLLRILFRNLDEKRFHILTNEQGLHLSDKNNLSADIAIFEKEKLTVRLADKQYASVPPKIQIEVDINADTEDFASPVSYTYLKTEKLFEFGVEKVIWILSESKKIMVATPRENWQVVDWHKDIEVIEGLSFCIGKYLKEEGSPFA